tara:strand:+ start:42 stop:200 length:159 start_codon:yes stop_codon:yes gene_type:complete
MKNNLAVGRFAWRKSKVPLLTPQSAVIDPLGVKSAAFDPSYSHVRVKIVVMV